MKTALLLVNLGTPQTASISDVRRYLRQFLSDPLVIDLPWLVRKILVEFVLLGRSKQSAKAYESIWLPEGSPLLVYTRDLQQALSHELGENYRVEIAMRYQRPSIAEALKKLSASGAERLIVLPLFPQYSRAVTGSIIACVNQELIRQQIKIPVHIKESFHKEASYIDASVELTKKAMDSIAADYLLLSYHGLPERQMHYNENYQKDCFSTSEAIARKLHLNKDQYQTSFQSRLGRTPWIKPYTDQVLPKLREQGIKNLAIACPSFVVDCLETLEEIGIRLREQWLSSGGEKFILVPALNASKHWVSALADELKATA